MQSKERHTLPKKERLNSRGLMDMLFAEGNSIFAYPIKLLYLPVEHKEKEIPAYLFSATVPKRIHKKANVRNLLKRRMREVYRRHKPQIIPGHDTPSYALMYILIDENETEYAVIEKAMIKLHKKLRQIIAN